MCAILWKVLEKFQLKWDFGGTETVIILLSRNLRAFWTILIQYSTFSLAKHKMVYVQINAFLEIYVLELSVGTAF